MVPGRDRGHGANPWPPRVVETGVDPVTFRFSAPIRGVSRYHRVPSRSTCSPTGSRRHPTGRQTGTRAGPAWRRRATMRRSATWTQPPRAASVTTPRCGHRQRARRGRVARGGEFLFPEPDNLRRQVVLASIQSLTHQYILGAADWGRLLRRLVVRATVSPSEDRRFRSGTAASPPPAVNRSATATPGRSPRSGPTGRSPCPMPSAMAMSPCPPTTCGSMSASATPRASTAGSPTPSTRPSPSPHRPPPAAAFTSPPPAAATTTRCASSPTATTSPRHATSSKTILAIDRADIPAVTQRRSLAQSTPPHPTPAAPAPTPRCAIPDWFPSALADAQKALGDAQARQAEQSAQRADVTADVANADAVYAEVHAATAADRDALHHAEARTVEARRRRTAAQHRLDNAPRRHRRTLRHELNEAEQQLERAENYLARTRQRTGPAIEQHNHALATQRDADDQARNHDISDSLDAMLPTVGEHRLHVRSLTTWQHWAQGHDVPNPELQGAFVTLARQTGAERQLAATLRDQLGTPHHPGCAPPATSTTQQNEPQGATSASSSERGWRHPPLAARRPQPATPNTAPAVREQRLGCPDRSRPRGIPRGIRTSCPDRRRRGLPALRGWLGQLLTAWDRAREVGHRGSSRGAVVGASRMARPGRCRAFEEHNRPRRRKRSPRAYREVGRDRGDLA